MSFIDGVYEIEHHFDTVVGGDCVWNHATVIIYVDLPLRPAARMDAFKSVATNDGHIHNVTMLSDFMSIDIHFVAMFNAVYTGRVHCVYH